MSELTDELKGLWTDIKKSLAAAGRIFTKKRIIISAVIITAICAVLEMYSYARFDEVNFIKVIHGYASLDEERFYYEINDSHYILLKENKAVDRFLGELGEVEIGQVNAVPYDNIMIDGQRAFIEIDDDAVFGSDKYLYIKVIRG